MKKLLLLFALTPSLAFASDDPVDCGKKEGKLSCEVKQERVVIDSVSVNGGACPLVDGAAVLHRAYAKGEKFNVDVKGGDEFPIPFTGCGYVRTVTIKTHDGKKKTFNAL